MISCIVVGLQFGLGSWHVVLTLLVVVVKDWGGDGSLFVLFDEVDANLGIPGPEQMRTKKGCGGGFRIQARNSQQFHVGSIHWGWGRNSLSDFLGR